MEKLQLSKPTSEIINDILSNFNFEKVHAYMVLTDWKWKGERPTKEDLYDNAYNLLWKVANIDKARATDEGVCIGTGGFYAYRFVFEGKICYKLSFEPCRSSNY